jgi:hypothetical protein
MICSICRNPVADELVIDPAGHGFEGLRGAVEVRTGAFVCVDCARRVSASWAVAYRALVLSLAKRPDPPEVG